MRSVLISTSLSSFICSWLASWSSQQSPSQQRFPWALQLKEQILKEKITDGRIFFKMPFHPCPSGCGHFLSADDGHDHCLQCLGFQQAEDVLVDDSCACCGRMSMTLLRSRLSFLKGLALSAATCAGLSGSSRGLPAGALGDLRVTVRASPLGTSPRTSYSSRWGRWEGCNLLHGICLSCSRLSASACHKLVTGFSLWCFPYDPYVVTT